ncbi:MAG: S8 family serine peptidase, partial [Actinomycetota bacterium]|nr:S8 family serine peptidase [Actinomycetota bacterium]
MAPSSGDDAGEYVEGEVIVRFGPGVSSFTRRVVHDHLGAVPVRSFRVVPGLELVSLPPGASVARTVAAYNAMPAVAYAQPNYIKRIAATPNDPAYRYLWGLENTGQTVNGTAGTADADIDAPEAWDITTGSRDVVIAVIDTGIDYNHPDLAPNIWVNPGEVPGNGIDDDGNGYIDDVHGWNAVANNGNPMDDHGHGTHCAGTIGAAGDNGRGVTGVNWNVSLMAVKMLNANGSGTTADAIECF